MPSQKELRRLFTYEPETGRVFWKKRKSPNISEECVAGYLHKKRKRWHVKVGTKTLMLHRVIWVYQFGDIPEGMVVDHIDHDSSNNKLSNLRCVSRAENNRNMKPRKNKTGVTGVSFDKKRQCWRVQIAFNKKRVYLGSFKKIADAVRARRCAQQAFGYHKNHATVI